MRIIVCGGRHYNDRDRMFDVLSEHKGEDVTIIHGGAPGADTIAGVIAEELGFKKEVHHANWVGNGRMAGPIRNRKMAEAGADLCIAFPGGRGTGGMILCAEVAGIPVQRIFL